MKNSKLVVGDMVRIHDYSYAYIIDGFDTHVFRTAEHGDNEEWVIVSDGCDLPAWTSIGKERNDTIIKGNTTGRIVYVKKRFLRRSKCECCGHAL